MVVSARGRSPCVGKKAASSSVVRATVAKNAVNSASVSYMLPKRFLSTKNMGSSAMSDAAVIMR